MKIRLVNGSVVSSMNQNPVFTFSFSAFDFNLYFLSFAFKNSKVDVFVMKF